ncbi:BrxA/BrxB family bacilliredoxin [Longimicrobium terrae]|jgi:putative YphP/YqiW family bacilliredoxin|uniref:Putative YphP/YqiW family bacilliredoxin n=1 Tax=Longimicrobium terrae TaxID=1639882 RepID=A0A841GZB0_9BACT|nr:BrxA/BrxB family bacilliredoxin [Longimicrobium terrae]MBB4636410.1 putative YphP/YqiW family bacilliredoxin [Longimicrobium terrae]MBB6071066.1 putative YphP/YqiW family bacilliredoxin [Longimicrobium terrae]NNC29087.1 BrxA/BrxB family bacilliredoxin [Longimicrobium terrae]
MPYPEMMIAPMRQELTRLGVQEMKSADEVRTTLGEAAEPTLLVVNSMCGCAARNARPAVAMALQNDRKPVKLTTVFAGQDLDATAAARQYIHGYPPSSPSIALLKDGDVAFMLERHQIEGRSADAIAEDLVNAFNQYC